MRESGTRIELRRKPSLMTVASAPDEVEVIAASDFPPDPAGYAPGAPVDQITRFGVSLAATAVDGDSDPDLMIGISGYSAPFPFPVERPGLLCVAYGLDEGATGNGVLDGGQRCYGDRQFGAPASTGPTFGAASAAGRLDGALGRDLVVSSPATHQVFVLRNVPFANGFERPPYP